MRLLFTLFLLVMSSKALACEPCMEVIGLEETVQRSDLIIVGERIDAGKTPRDELQFGPEFITIRVLKVLKGTSDASLLNVRSWYGMCPYGIQLKAEGAIVFLSRKNGGTSYAAVNDGCAQKSLEIIGGKVSLDGEVMTVDQFAKSYLE